MHTLEHDDSEQGILVVRCYLTVGVPKRDQHKDRAGAELAPYVDDRGTTNAVSRSYLVFQSFTRVLCMRLSQRRDT